MDASQMEPALFAASYADGRPVAPKLDPVVLQQAAMAAPKRSSKSGYAPARPARTDSRTQSQAIALARPQEIMDMSMVQNFMRTLVANAGAQPRIPAAADVSLPGFTWSSAAPPASPVVAPIVTGLARLESTQSLPGGSHDAPMHSIVASGAVVQQHSDTSGAAGLSAAVADVEAQPKVDVVDTLVHQMQLQMGDKAGNAPALIPKQKLTPKQTKGPKQTKVEKASTKQPLAISLQESKKAMMFTNTKYNAPRKMGHSTVYTDAAKSVWRLKLKPKDLHEKYYYFAKKNQNPKAAWAVMMADVKKENGW